MRRARDLGRGTLRRRAEFFASREARRLRDQHFSIIADDCWGGEIYKLAGVPFNSPFIGLFVMKDCYLKILADLPHALGSDLVECGVSRYAYVERLRAQEGRFPIGVLEDIDAEIAFMHYSSWRATHQKWLRRRERVDPESLLVKITLPSNDPRLEQFALLPYARKLLVSDKPYKLVNTAVSPHWDDAVIRTHVGATRFDHIDWLNGGSGQVTGLRRVIREFKFAGWR